MVLTNAERQARHREKLKAAAALAPGMTPQQIADREAVIAGSLFPILPAAGGPLFMGLHRNGWRNAPGELVDYFEMREAHDRWNEEWREFGLRRAAADVRAKEIVASVGRKASKILREHGSIVLCRAYDQDPALKLCALPPPVLSKKAKASPLASTSSAPGTLPQRRKA